MNEIVKYNNKLNEVSFGKFSPIELDLFFVILSKMKNEKTGRAVFTFDELKELSKYKQTSSKAFQRDIDRTYEKYLGLKLRINYENGDYTRFNLFSEFTVSPTNKNVILEINPKYDYVLYELMGESFTRFELAEFCELQSKYSKTLYRLMKQYRTMGRYYIKIEDFREQLDIPTKYRFSDINKWVLEPILKELPNYFTNLKLNKITSKKRGNPIIAYEFTFKAEKPPKKGTKGSKEQANNTDKEKIAKNQEYIDKLNQLYKDKAIG